MKLVAFVPARGGSKRVPRKNLRQLAGLPLIAHTLIPAVSSGIFDRVIVSTDCTETAETAARFGGETPFLRPSQLAGDSAPDIGWVLHALEFLKDQHFDAFAILRPTSPFRTEKTLQRALSLFGSVPGADSLRAVEPCRQHPGKMWREAGEFIKPLLDDFGASPPWHSSATQSLPRVLAQNASLEIAWTKVPLQSGTIAGSKVVGFQTEGYEGFDINSPEDFLLAEVMVERNIINLERRA